MQHIHVDSRVQMLHLHGLLGLGHTGTLLFCAKHGENPIESTRQKLSLATETNIGRGSVDFPPKRCGLPNLSQSRAGRFRHPLGIDHVKCQHRPDAHTTRGTTPQNSTLQLWGLPAMLKSSIWSGFHATNPYKSYIPYICYVSKPRTPGEQQKW